MTEHYINNVIVTTTVITTNHANAVVNVRRNDEDCVREEKI